jgi:uncharacterized membrane protein
MQAPEDTLPADRVGIHEVPLLRPLVWLRLGWRDIAGAPGASLMHGLLVAAGGWVILLFALRWWYLLPGAFSGFVLVGPILATGLYELSRRLAAGEPATLASVFAAWRRGTRPLVWLGLGLALGGTLWVMLSAVLVALFVRAPITDVEAFLRHIVLSQGSNLFPLWLMAGGLGASLVFALTVISAPLLLDRDTDLATALLVSVRAVGANPVTMALWATIIMLATALSMATAMLGFVLAIPLIGHATWHAYRDLVDAGALPARPL